MVGSGQDSPCAPRVVPLQARSQVEYAAAITACWKRGDAVLPLPADLPKPELGRTMTALDAGGPARPGTAVVISTSGSTGPPKGVELSYGALTASARSSLDRLEAGPQDRWLCCMPLHHIAGIQVLVRSVLLGVPPVIHEGLDPAAVAAEQDVTLVALVPTMLHRLLDAGVDVARFRRILLGGAPPSPGLLEQARRAGARVVVSYGMSETCGGCVYDGVPLGGVRVRLGPAGRVEIAGPVLMDGYRNDPERTAATLVDGWLQTGDVGSWDPAGRLVILGRSDDVIITGGEKVAATEIAELLGTHPGVAEAVVFGRPDPEWGQRVVARVVPSGEPPTLSELRAFVKERVAAFKAPAELEIADPHPPPPSPPSPPSPAR